VIFKKNIIRPLILSITISIIISWCPSCSEATTTSIGYKNYEMKSDDIRLTLFNHPLFSFEYPEDFQLVKINLPYEGISANYSYVKFRGSSRGSPVLRIAVQKPGFDGYSNASEKFEDQVTKATINTDNITIKKSLVYGITADYLEYFQITKEQEQIGETLYLERYMSYRAVVFNYSDLIWEISMYLYYYIYEPPEVREYFDHVIETFKFLE
jgi:hypothetical protein